MYFEDIYHTVWFAKSEQTNYSEKRRRLKS